MTCDHKMGRRIISKFHHTKSKPFCMDCGKTQEEIQKEDEREVGKMVMGLLNKVKSADLNTCWKKLKVSRRLVIGALYNLEDEGLLWSRMELRPYGEKHVQKWERTYYLKKDEPKKVYVVAYPDCDGGDVVLGVFSTRPNAEKFIERYKKQDKDANKDWITGFYLDEG